MKPQTEAVVTALRRLGPVLARRGSLAGPLVLAGFVLAAFWIWLPQDRGGVVAPEVATRDIASRLAESRAEMAALIPVTAERPLFQADRRPLAAPEAPAAPAEATLVLVGILGDGEERIALVRRSSSPELFQIEAGGVLGRWQILSVDISSITVQENDGTFYTLRLDG